MIKKIGSLLIYYYLIVNSSGQPVTLRQGPQKLFVSEVVRVRRQAGYVYDKPNVSFDLPTRAPSLTVTTQAPTVDRTRAQMMYYAYPAPAAGGDTVNIGASSGTTAGISGGSMATSTGGGGVGGYNYGRQNAASGIAQSQTTGSTQAGSVQSTSAGTLGYGYNAPPAGSAPVSTGIQQSTDVGSSGYGYNAPSAVAAQVSNSVESTQTANVDSSQANPIDGSGYDYNSPTNPPGSGVVQASDVSTNAPKYLPPTSGGSANGISSGSVRIRGSAINSGSLATVAQPIDQYLPPLISKPSPPVAQVLDQYLPPNPNRQVDSPTSQTSGTGLVPSSNYLPPIPPNLNQSSIPATPRPFAPAPSVKYLPNGANSQASGSISSSTPASPYLPPVL